MLYLTISDAEQINQAMREMLAAMKTTHRVFDPHAKPGDPLLKELADKIKGWEATQYELDQLLKGH